MTEKLLTGTLNLNTTNQQTKHKSRADKNSYPHDSNNQSIILRLQVSFVMINVQLILV